MAYDLNTHVPLEDFEVQDSCLVIAGQTITDIASELGGTPFYIYLSSLIEKRIAHIRSCIPDSIKLHYAVKANPMRDVVNLVQKLVDGLDVASAGELEIALASGVNPAEISFAGPGKRETELERAIDANIVINAESPTEIERIARIAQSKSVIPRVAVRVNPSFELKSSGMQMSGGPKQFGIDDDQVPAVLTTMKSLPVEFWGFHIFTGSQNLSAAAICEAQEQAVRLAIDLTAHSPTPPKMINVGGGFGIPYFRGDKPLDLRPIGENLERLQARVARDLSGHAELVIELGRYIVGEAGIYICKVLDKKVSRDTTFLVCDGGLHHHLAASGNFGQVIRKNFPVLVANKIGTGDEETVSIVGPLCTPLDLLGDKMRLERAEIGDLVAVFQSGAYGYSASPHLFLSHPPPLEVLK